MKMKHLYLLVFLFGTTLYLNTLPNKYAYDDYSVVEGNKFTTQGLAGIFGHLFTDSFTGFTGQKNLFRGGRYRPLSLITFSIEYQFFGANPFVSHLINILIYGWLCMLLFKVFHVLFREKIQAGTTAGYLASLSLAAALVFAAHPIHTEVVANIKGRDELLAMLFSLLAWNSVLLAVDRKKAVHGFYAGLFFFLALMAKESSAPMLLLIPVSLYCFRDTRDFRKNAVTPTLFLLGGFLIFLFIRQSVLGWTAKPSMAENILSNSFMHANGLSERYGTTLYTLWLYFRLLVIPHPLTIDYYPFYIPYVGLMDPRAILPFLLYAGLVVAAIYYTLKRTVAGYGLFFYLVALFPVSNLAFIIGPFMGERFAFIPSAGFVLAMVWILRFLGERVKVKQAFQVIILLILVTYSGKTIARNFDWKDNFTLYSKDVLTSVNSAVITRGAGHEYLLKAEAAQDTTEKRGWARKAIPLLEQAESLNKSTTETFLLGNAYYENGSYGKALDQYLETLGLNRDYRKAYDNFFVSVNRIKDPAGKIRYYDRLIGVVGERYEPYYNKGLIFGKEMHMTDSSILNLVHAYKIDTMQVDCLGDLGVAFAMKRDFRQSAFYLEKAYRLNPNDQKIKQNLAASYFNMGDIRRANELAGGKR
jgi:protein O-mannosyl-transferase